MRLKENKKKIRIGDRLIGEGEPAYIIAEIGINHNGDKSVAKSLIDVAVEANADAVKFQKRYLPALYINDVLEFPHRYEQNFQYMIPLLKRFELSEKDIISLKYYSDEKNITFLCTPFDRISATFLAMQDVLAYKIASADLTNIDLLHHVTRFEKPMLVSTGMSKWEDIQKCVGFLIKSQVDFALLHCKSAYPVEPRKVDLRQILRLKEFLCPVGYSSHDIGGLISIGAVAMGANIIEKHITLDRTLEGPDHKVSLEPEAFIKMVSDVRRVEEAMGQNSGSLLQGEILNQELFGKSLIAATDISKGTLIRKSMILVKGPGKGISPNRQNELIGKYSKRHIYKDELFLLTDLGIKEEITCPPNFKTDWGLIARFQDFDFIDSFLPKVVEFHLTEKDLELNFECKKKSYTKLVIHGPEYMGEKLFDLCSLDDSLRSASVKFAQKTISLAKHLGKKFFGKPKVIFHPGAMSLNAGKGISDLKSMLNQSLNEIDFSGVELLLENLPPFPWYFGGQWHGHYFLSASEVTHFCLEIGINICFDLSHAALYCTFKNESLVKYIQRVKPFIKHIHFADAKGLDGEGLQIGDGDIKFEEIMPLFKDFEGTWVPEIWQGHLNFGEGFKKAMIHLDKYQVL